MKQQVVDTNTGVHDPNLLFEINNMSMNKVQVFPDGELDIQARADRSNTAAFVKPTGAAVAGRAMQSRHSGSLTGAGPGPGTPYLWMVCQRFLAPRLRSTATDVRCPVTWTMVEMW